MLNNKSGVSLIEFLVAFAVSAVALMALGYLFETYRYSARVTELKNASLSSIIDFDRVILNQFRLHRSDVDLNKRRLSTNQAIAIGEAKSNNNTTIRGQNRTLVIEQVKLNKNSPDNTIVRYEYEVVCVDVDKKRTTKEKQLWKSYWEAGLKNNPCVLPAKGNPCDWETQTVAIRQNIWEGWSDAYGNAHRTSVAIKGSKCFPQDIFRVNTSTRFGTNACTLRQDPNFFINSQLGMSFCSWAAGDDTLKSGRGMMMDIYAFYMPNIPNAVIKSEYKRSVLDRQISIGIGSPNLIE